MPRRIEGMRSVGIHVEAELAAKMEALARDNGRSFSAEVRSALRRHLATPPVLRPETPPMRDDDAAERQPS